MEEILERFLLQGFLGLRAQRPKSSRCLACGSEFNKSVFLSSHTFLHGGFFFLGGEEGAILQTLRL